jgi:ADP-ribose pyrophosphatase YjhB (NUDIX family)
MILQKLMYSDGLKYSEIKPNQMEGSSFVFHLNKLLKDGYVAKKNEKYVLTENGKEMANRMDLGDKKVKDQAKVSVIVVCQKGSGDSKRYLLYTRLKSPFYSFQGFPTGKVKKGESILSAAERELNEETGLIGNPKLFAVIHSRIYSQDKHLLEDKIFFACKFINPKGRLVGGPEGIYDWVDSKKVWNYLKRPVYEIKEIFKLLNKSSVSFVEYNYTTQTF